MAVGITNLKKLVGFGCGLTKQINTSLSDGWQWTDSIGFVDEISEIPGIVKSFSDIKTELGDLDAGERAELGEYVQTEFDIPNDRVEVVIEHSINLALSVVGLVQEWKAIA